MITLKCTKCKTTLTMDDAFAGGVCRCQHCGTIQTVPSRRRDTGNSSGAVAQAANGSKSRSAYERNAAGAPGSGLDELGEIIASSGLSSSRLRQGPTAPPRISHGATAPVSSALRVSRRPLIVGAAVAVILVVGLVGWLIMGGGGGEGIAGGSPDAVGQPTAGPRYAGLPLAGPNVVYLLDRGDGSRDVFGEIKEATFASIASLDSNRRYQIVFWDNGNERAHPSSGTVPAGVDAVPAAREALDDVYAFGLSDVRPALQKAMSVSPDEVVIVTAKGYLLDDDFVKTVKNAVGNSAVKVHTVMVGTEDLAGPLPAVAAAHGGQFRAMSAGQLREFARSSGL